LRVAQQLRDAGISLQSLRKVVDHLQQRKDLDAPPAALSSTFLLSDGTDVFEKRAEDALVSVLRKPGQGALFLVPLYEVVEELREKIARAA